MKKLVSAKCPGCGAEMFVLSVESERKGVARVSASDRSFATFYQLETVELLCVNGCEVTVHRGSDERTARQLDDTGPLPLVAEVGL